MGATLVLSAPDGPHVGPMNLAIRVSNHSKWKWTITQKSSQESLNQNIFRGIYCIHSCMDCTEWLVYKYKQMVLLCKITKTTPCLEPERSLCHFSRDKTCFSNSKWNVSVLHNMIPCNSIWFHHCLMNLFSYEFESNVHGLLFCPVFRHLPWTLRGWILTI